MAAKGFQDDLAEDLVAQARALRPLLARNAPLHDSRGELTQEAWGAVVAAGFLKMAVPRRWDGLCVSSNTMARVAAELAKGCPSTAWVATVMNSSVWLLSIMSDAMQEDVFKDGPPLVCSVGSPPGRAKAVDGGYLVNGRWPYASGSHHSHWAHAPVMPEDGALPAIVAMPMADLEIERSWHIAGMKGTGSDTIVASNLFVPTRRVQLMDQPVGTHAPGKKQVGEASDHWSPLPLLRAKSFGVLVGAAEGLLEAVCEGAGSRPIVYTNYTRKSDSNVFQAALGEAASRIRTARLIMDQTTRSIDAAAAAGRPAPYAERAATRGSMGMAVELLAQAVDKLMNISGSGAFFDASITQRYWRDFSVASRHAALVPEVAYEVCGRGLLGGEPVITMPDFV